MKLTSNVCPQASLTLRAMLKVFWSWTHFE